MVRRKNIRLAPLNYVGLRDYFITICTFNRRRYFCDIQLATSTIELLRATASVHSFAIHAYCLMPDHLHFVAQGLQPSSDLLQLTKSFKSQSCRAFLRQRTQPLWQNRFFDHILRPNDSFAAVAWYIWLNPVRKGLCPSPAAYPFSGSFTPAISRLAEASAAWVPPWKSDISPQ
jgi:putative transposase